MPRVAVTKARNMMMAVTLTACFLSGDVDRLLLDFTHIAGG